MHRRRLILGGVLPLALILGNTWSNRFTREMSEGNIPGRVEIPFASRQRIIHELSERLAKDNSAAAVFTDADMSSLVKFESYYAHGRPFYSLVSYYYPDRRTRDFEARPCFDLHSPAGATNCFFFDTRTGDTSLRNADLLSNAPGITVVNRRSPTSGAADLLTLESSRNIRNHLVFVESDLGRSYGAANRLFTSLFPLEAEPISGLSMAAVARHLLFRIVNPAERIRVLLAYSGTNAEAPKAVAIGTARESFGVAGGGGFRLVSPPLQPQHIRDGSYVAIDMQRDPERAAEHRTGLMRAFGVNTPWAFRRIVGAARQIALVTDDEYRALVPPAQVEIPSDLFRKNIEYSGFFDDGWVSRTCMLRLNAQDENSVLTIRGVVPDIFASSDRPLVSVTIDGTGRAEFTAKPGRFEYKVPLGSNLGTKTVQLDFTSAAKLPGEDGRPVSALLKCIGIGPDACKENSAPDILDSGSGLQRGNNWYSLEHRDNESFRWVANDAEIYLPAHAASTDLAIDVEPGPGVRGRALHLIATTDGGDVVGNWTLKGRDQVRISAAQLNAVTPHTIRLRSDTATQSVPHDPRTLAFRVFRVAFAPPAQTATATDDISSGSSITIGGNWYPLEHFKGETFRWFNNDAQFSVGDASDLRAGLILEAEPGPGARSIPLLVRIFDSSGRQVQAFDVKAREAINLHLPAPKAFPAQFRLHVENGGKKIPSDPRVLNLRVFRVTSSAVKASRDITSDGITLGRGWYDFEVFNGQSFRWINNDAQFSLPPSWKGESVLLDVEPGPSLGSPAATVSVCDGAGREFQSFRLEKRETVRLLVPRTSRTILLHVMSQDKKVPGDSRMLNLRVFSVSIAH